MSKKYLIVLVTVILLLIFGLGGWWYYAKVYLKPVSMEQNEIANWKTYRNEKYGLEFKYPSTWQVINDNPLTIREWPSVSKIGDYWLSVLIYKSDKSLKPEDIIEWVKKEYLGRTGYQLKGRITGYIDGRPIAQVLTEGTVQSPANVLTYVVKNSSEILEFSCLITLLADSNNLCDKVLNSIKFVK